MSPALDLEATTFMMARLGIPASRIAEQQKVNRLTAIKYSENPDLIFFDPPYFNKMADQYEKENVSILSRKDYLDFFRELFPLFREHSKTNARIAFLTADWRDFQGKAAKEEDPEVNKEEGYGLPRAATHIFQT